MKGYSETMVNMLRFYVSIKGTDAPALRSGRLGNARTEEALLKRGDIVMLPAVTSTGFSTLTATEQGRAQLIMLDNAEAHAVNRTMGQRRDNVISAGMSAKAFAELEGDMIEADVESPRLTIKADAGSIQGAHEHTMVPTLTGARVYSGVVLRDKICTVCGHVEIATAPVYCAECGQPVPEAGSNLCEQCAVWIEADVESPARIIVPWIPITPAALVRDQPSQGAEIEPAIWNQLYADCRTLSEMADRWNWAQSRTGAFDNAMPNGVQYAVNYLRDAMGKCLAELFGEDTSRAIYNALGDGDGFDQEVSHAMTELAASMDYTVNETAALLNAFYALPAGDTPEVQAAYDDFSSMRGMVWDVVGIEPPEGSATWNADFSKCTPEQSQAWNREMNYRARRIDDVIERGRVSIANAEKREAAELAAELEYEADMAMRLRLHDEALDASGIR